MRFKITSVCKKENKNWKTQSHKSCPRGSNHIFSFILMMFLRIWNVTYIKYLNIDLLLKLLTFFKIYCWKTKSNTTLSRDHRTNLFLAQNNVRMLQCVAISPDMNHIEHPLDILGRALKMWTKFQEKYLNLRQH